MKIMTKILTAIVFILLFLAITVAFIMLGWSLFVVPVFGLPSLSFLQALGFALLASAFRVVSQSK